MPNGSRHVLDTMDRTRLILRLPPTIAEMDDRIADLLTAGDIACVILTTDGMNEGDLIRTVDRVRLIVQDADIAFLLDAHPELAAKTGCDGVVLPAEDGDPMGPLGEAGLTPLDMKATRNILGEDAILGTDCGAGRHAAMVTAEQGADFVAFAADEDLIAWWAEMFEVPSVALGGAGLTPEDAKRLCDAGADFLALDPESWLESDDPIAAVKAFDQACMSG